MGYVIIHSCEALLNSNYLIDALILKDVFILCFPCNCVANSLDISSEDRIYVFGLASGVS
jgi:hypothetical protein